MSPRKSALCFIDDDPEEINRFRTSLSNRFVIGAGADPETALEDLRNQGRNKPNLFLVDMYQPDVSANTDDEIKELHDAGEAFLKADAQYRSVLAKLRQTSNVGLQMARDLRKRYWFPPAICFFTRKGNLEDAIMSYEEVKINSIIKKPDPNPFDATDLTLKEAYDIAFQQGSENILGRIEKVIRSSSILGRQAERIVFFVLGVLASIMGGVIIELSV